MTWAAAQLGRLLLTATLATIAIAIILAVLAYKILTHAHRRKHPTPISAAQDLAIAALQLKASLSNNPDPPQ